MEIVLVTAVFFTSSILLYHWIDSEEQIIWVDQFWECDLLRRNEKH